MKDRIELDSVVLLGRTFDEYCRYFQLDDRDLRSVRILDIGAGVSSFCSEANSRGYDVMAADPIYELPVEVIAEKSAADLNHVLTRLPDAAHNYNWSFYRDPQQLREYRESARDHFLKHYASDQSRYVRVALPHTGFRANEFQLVLVSHLLFLYDDLFDYDFHKRSLLELARIAQTEIRIYPLTNMRAMRSSLLESLMRDPDCSALTFTVSKIDFEFLKNSDELLKINHSTR
jgi:hypothetical protein